MNERGGNGENGVSGSGVSEQQPPPPPPQPQHQRKRSRTFSNLSQNNNNYTPPSFSTNRGGGSGGGGGSGSNSNRNINISSSSKFQLDKNEKLLRLNVGGIPYDVVRTSLPLLETMMTDRWLDGCLLDSDGRIFIDRDGDAFGDILKYLRSGEDFLLALVRSSSSSSCALSSSTTSTRNNASSSGSGGGYYGATGSNGMNYYLGGMGNNHANHCASSLSNNFNFHYHPHLSPNCGDRLRRLRTEADYYGLHQLVHDIDVLTIGQKIVLEKSSWARVAGGCAPPQRRHQQQPPQGGNEHPVNHGENLNNGVGEMINHNNGAQNNEVEQNLRAMQRNDDDEEENDDPHEHEDQDMNEEADDAEANFDDEDEGEEEDAVGEADDDEEELHFEEEEGLDNIDPTQPLPYKHWSWSKQYGNPDILRPHPTHTSNMIVGQDGTYLIMLRLAAALPSPLARIKWDQEEEEGRRVTRGAARQRGSSNNNIDASDDNNSDINHHNSVTSGRSKEVEEDYFVTVNIEAPLQTVMDSVDESQTHFPLLRAGLWDYRSEEEVLHEDPVFATFCAADVVSLRSGDILSVSFMNDEVSRERAPFPDNAPPELVNSLTLVKVYGNALARYERLKSSPNVMSADLMGRARRDNDKGTRIKMIRDLRYTQEQHRDMDEENGWNYHRRAEEDTYQMQLDCEAEEFDRSLTRTAHWISPRNDFLPTPFQPPLHSHSSVLEFPHAGHYLLLGRVALGCRRDAQFHSVLSGGPIEGHRAQLSIRSVGGRLLHAVGFVFEDKPRLEWADLSILSENCMFNDVVHVPQAGTELSITTTGDCRLHPEGAEVGPFCSRVSQSLSCLLLDDDIMEGKFVTFCF